jgi:hypothetical protein
MSPAVDRRVRRAATSQVASFGAPAFAHRIVAVSVLVTVVLTIMAVIATSQRPAGSEWSVLRPGVGVAVGVAAWYPPRYSAVIAVCAAVAAGLGGAILGRPLIICLGNAIVAGAEAWIGARVLRGGGDIVPSLTDRQGLRRLVAACAAVAVVTALGLGGSAFFALGVDQVLPTLGLTVLTHVVGMLLVAPLFFRAPPPVPRVTAREVVLQWIALISTVAISFYFTNGIPIYFVVLPALVWGATRLQYRMFVVQLALALLSISELTNAGFGPFGPEEFGVVVRTLLVGSLSLTIGILFFTVLVGSALAATAQASLEESERIVREVIAVSVTGFASLYESGGELRLSGINASGRVILLGESAESSDSLKLRTIFDSNELTTLREALKKVTSHSPTPWTVQLISTRLGRVLEASMVGLAAPVVPRASFQFIDVTDREAVRARYAAERHRAVEIQAALVPQRSLVAPGYEIAGRSMASRALGGDFYDWYARPDGFTVSVGDVMGKGTGPSILAATLRTSLRLAGESRSPASALGRLATVVEAELSNAASFATMFTANVTAENGAVSYADAGHGLALICATDGTVTQLESKGLPLGVLADSAWVDKSDRLAIGDTLVLFSDGVLDLFDGTLAAIDEVALITQSAPSCEALLDQIFDLADPESLDDDITVVAVRRITIARE